MPHKGKQDPKKPKQTPRLKAAKAQVREANMALSAAREVGASKLMIARLSTDSVSAVRERSKAIRAQQGLPPLKTPRNR